MTGVAIGFEAAGAIAKGLQFPGLGRAWKGVFVDFQTWGPEKSLFGMGLKLNERFTHSFQPSSDSFEDEGHGFFRAKSCF